MSESASFTEPLPFPRSDSSGTQPPSSTPPKPNPREAKPLKALPTERITFPNQLKVLRSFAVASGASHQPVMLAEVAKLAEMNPNTVSLTTPFFVDVGLLKKPDATHFVPSEEVFDFHSECEWNRPTPAWRLARALTDEWFADELRKRLNMRESMTIDDTVDALRQVVKATPKHATNLRLIVEYLIASGILERDGQVVKLRRGESMERTDRPVVPVPRQTETPLRSTPPPADPPAPPAKDDALSFNVSIRINLSELAGWSPDRITALFTGVAQVIAAKNADGGSEQR